MDNNLSLTLFGDSITVLTEIWIGSLVKVSVVLVAACLMVALWRHRAAATRHFVLTLALLCSLLIPVGSAVWVFSNAPVLPTLNGVDLVQRAAAVVSLGEIVVTPSLSLPTWWSLALLVWLGGVLVFGLRELIGHVRLRTVLRQSHPIENSALQRLFTSCLAATGIRRPVRLLTHARRPVPFTCGLFRPAVVLTARDITSDHVQVRRILLHELAHVERFDAAANAIARWAMVLFWFHPLVWLVVHRLHIEQERACDDRVVNGGERSTEYAEFLLGYARHLRSRLALLPEGMTFLRAGSLRARIQSLLNPRRRTQPASRATLTWCVAGALAGVLVLSCVRTPTAEKKTGEEATAAAVPAPGDLIKVDEMPVMTKSVQPEYPQALADSQITGTVWIRALVSIDGTVIDARPVNPNPHDAFNTAALEAAYKNEYKPAIKDSRPVPVWVTYQVSFQLQTVLNDEGC
ncbi:MAG: hypothetical protein Kow0074_23930 [Candidatus Zixiibacteriota bacterium]